MNKLSANNRPLKLAGPIVFTIIGIVVAFLFPDLPPTLKIIELTCVLVIGILIIRKAYNRAVNLFYDCDFLYLKNNRETKKVKLTDITRVQLSFAHQRIVGIQYHKYSIDFKSGPKQIDTIEFWVGGLNDYLSEFENYLAYYSPKTKIVH